MDNSLMRKQILLLLFLTIPLNLSIATPCIGPECLAPPPGNSLYRKAKTRNGVHYYQCRSGKWQAHSAHATLMDSEEPSKEIGNYSFIYRVSNPRHAGVWTFVNSDGDAAESGNSISLVSAEQIRLSGNVFTNNLDRYLAMASTHKYLGVASRISYIARMNTKGGLPQLRWLCKGGRGLLKVPFSADFLFFTQDLIPPPVPATLTVGTVKLMPIAHYFAKGNVEYRFSGGLWRRKHVKAKLFDVPGGTLAGSYSSLAKPDPFGGIYYWNVSAPNGFALVGKYLYQPVLVTPGCLPWSLLTVTTSINPLSHLGKYSKVQMLSTWGGLPPAQNLFKRKQSLGEIWKEPFSAIFWVFSDIY